MTDRGESRHDIELAQLRRLEIASSGEAITLILLVGIAVPLKHLAGYPLAVQIMGPVHGLMFLAYIWTALQTVSGSDGWKGGEIARLFISAMIPLGGFFNLPLLARKRAAARLASATQ